MEKSIRKIKGYCILFVIGFSLLYLSLGVYPDDSRLETVTQRDRISGRISGKEDSFISVVYRQEKNRAYTMGFSLDRNTRVVNKDDVGQLARGDLVVVDYRETLGHPGPEDKVIKRIAEKIRFIDEGLRFRAIKKEKTR